MYPAASPHHAHARARLDTVVRHAAHARRTTLATRRALPCPAPPPLIAAAMLLPCFGRVQAAAHARVRLDTVVRHAAHARRTTLATRRALRRPAPPPLIAAAMLLPCFGRVQAAAHARVRLDTVVRHAAHARRTTLATRRALRRPAPPPLIAAAVLLPFLGPSWAAAHAHARLDTVVRHAAHARRTTLATRRALRRPAPPPLIAAAVLLPFLGPSWAAAHAHARLDTVVRHAAHARRTTLATRRALRRPAPPPLIAAAVLLPFLGPSWAAAHAHARLDTVVRHAAHARRTTLATRRALRRPAPPPLIAAAMLLPFLGRS